MITFIQNEKIKVEEQGYEKEYNTLKSAYDSQYRVIYDEISKIVGGQGIPSISPEEKTKYEISAEAPDSEQGIPEYWQLALKNSAYFPLNEKDEKILVHLKDIKMKVDDANINNFTIEFVFSENEYFTPNVLTKTYFFNSETDDLEKTQGSPINWSSQEKNPRVEIKTKKIKKGKSVETKKVENIVPSFFDLFADQTKDDYAASDEANFWKDDFFANSLEYYLDIIDTEDDFSGEDEEFDDEEDESDDGAAPKKKSKAKGGDEKNEKCKNQ